MSALKIYRFALLSLALWPVFLCAATITVSPQGIGKTPSILGYVTGHFMPGSNTLDWWQYSGTKAARVFLSRSDIEVSDDITGWGDGVTTLDQFTARRAALRANPLSTVVSPQTTPAYLRSPYINWAYLNNKFANSIIGLNRTTANYLFGTLQNEKVETEVQLYLSLGQFPFTTTDDWAGNWELWQYSYFTAYYLAGKYDVRRYSMYNEPNTKDPNTNLPYISTEQWLHRLRLASDALQAGVNDANRDYGKNLQPLVYAPTTAGGKARLPDWGQPALDGLHLLYDGVTNDPTWTNFQTYSFQSYYMNPASYVADVTTLRAGIAPYISPGSSIALAITEFNVKTNTDLDATTSTLDSADLLTAFGRITLSLAQTGIDEMYNYKFSQTTLPAPGYLINKLGGYYVNNDSTGGLASLDNIGGITRAGEIWRLFVRAAGKARSRLAVTTSTDLGSVDVLAIHDPETDNYYVLSMNWGTTPVTLSYDVSALGIPSGNRAMIYEVSPTEWSGGVRFLTPVTAGIIAPSGNSQPANSFWLAEIHRSPQLVVAPQVTPVLGVLASADGTLRDGVNRTKRLNYASTLAVRNDVTNVDNRSVALIGFDLSGINLSDLDIVTLSLYTASTTSNVSAQAHVYGLDAEAVDETSAVWATQSQLLQNVPAGALIANNVVQGQGVNVHIQGQLLASSSTSQEKQIDVTKFIRAQTGTKCAFLVVQDARWDTSLLGKTPDQVTPNDGDTQAAGLSIVSLQGTTSQRPKLNIIRRVAPLSAWRYQYFGTTQAVGNAADLADPDGDGVSNLVEYALGTYPLSANSVNLPTSGLTGSPASLTLTFNRARADVTYIVEASSDLKSWTPIATNPGNVGETVTTTDSIALTGASSRFLRLRITQP